MSKENENNFVVETGKSSSAAESNFRDAIFETISNSNPPSLIARLLAEIAARVDTSQYCEKLRISLSNFEPKIAREIEKFADDKFAETNDEEPLPKWLDDNFVKILEEDYKKRNRNRTF
ncbi:hypothetical protein KAI54_02675 [Candidatus Gracilibacteria bacterium]|nr:hypothetical protein [Candidatus Gracilibacteria bacterium]